MTDEQFSNLFKRGTPAPSDGDWASDARRRHGRRRAVGVGVAAVAALAIIATPLALNLGPGRPQVALQAEGTTSPAPVPPADTNPPTLDAATVCASPGELGEDLPEGAVKLWLCGDGDAVMGGRTGPPEPLTIGVDQAIATFQSLPVFDDQMACTMEYTLAFTVIAEYPDGSRRGVPGSLHGCKTVGNRSDAFTFYGELERLWAEQRAVVEPPETSFTADEACSLPVSILALDPTAATSGFLCDQKDGVPSGGVALPEDLTDAVLADLKERAVDGSPSALEIPPGPHLRLITPYGEPIVVARHAEGLYQFGSKVWRPSAEVRAQLEELASTFGETVAPSDPPPLLWRETCVDPAANASTTVPSSAEWISICPTDATLAEPIDALTDPARIARALEALEAASGDPVACSAKKPIYVLVGEGIEATAIEVMACGDLEPLSTIKALFTEQRAADEMESFRGGPVCPVLNSVFSPAMPSDPQSATACVGWAEGTGIEVTLPGELATRIAQAASAEGSPVDGAAVPSGDTIVIVNRDGEPITMTRIDGTYSWTVADTAYEWTPTNELSAELDGYFRL